MDLLMRLFLTSKKVMNQMSSWTCLLVLVSINQLRDQLVLRLNSYLNLNELMLNLLKYNNHQVRRIGAK